MAKTGEILPVAKLIAENITTVRFPPLLTLPSDTDTF